MFVKVHFLPRGVKFLCLEGESLEAEEYHIFVQDWVLWVPVTRRVCQHLLV